MVGRLSKTDGEDGWKILKKLMENIAGRSSRNDGEDGWKAL